MDAEELLDSVRADDETALSRLGSSKALYAATGGEMDAGHVLRAAADDASTAHVAFEAWTDEEGDETAVETFVDAQRRTERQLDTVQDELDGHDPAHTAPLAEYLRGLEGTATRAGGLLGWSVVSGKTLDQVVGFFVGEADPRTASTLRTVREDTEAVQERALELLAELDDRESAAEAAHGAVGVAYDDYVETLEGMGVDPKNVC